MTTQSDEGLVLIVDDSLEARRRVLARAFAVVESIQLQVSELKEGRHSWRPKSTIELPTD